MSKGIDFTTINRPTMPLTLRSDPPVALRIKFPTEGQMKGLEQAGIALNKLAEGENNDLVDALYTFVAALISNNRECRTVTVNDLKGKYDVALEDIILFLNAYAEFINEVSSSKN